MSNGLVMPTYKLLSGYEMPVIGLDMIEFPKEKAENWTLLALNTGYRFFDSAFIYNNEQEIGQALKKWFAQGGKREDVFITNKLPRQGLRSEDVSLYLELSLKNMDLDYIDMYLIHNPVGTKRTDNLQIKYDSDGKIVFDPSTDHTAVWKEMEKQVKAGKIRSIGVSNFNQSQFIRLWDSAEIKPSNLQMENNVYLQQRELVEFAQGLGVVVSGYSPIGSPDYKSTNVSLAMKTLPELIENPVVKALAAKYKKTTRQIVQRYNLQRKIVVSAEISDPAEIKENLKSFDFTLNSEDMSQLKSLDQHYKYMKYNMLSMIGVESHPEYPHRKFLEQLLN